MTLKRAFFGAGLISLGTCILWAIYKYPNLFKGRSNHRPPIIFMGILLIGMGTATLFGYGDLAEDKD